MSFIIWIWIMVLLNCVRVILKSFVWILVIWFLLINVIFIFLLSIFLSFLIFNILNFLIIYFSGFLLYIISINLFVIFIILNFISNSKLELSKSMTSSLCSFLRISSLCSVFIIIIFGFNRGLSLLLFRFYHSINTFFFWSLI